MPNRRRENIQVDAPFDAKPVLPDGLPAITRVDGSEASRLAGAFGQLAEESGRWADAAAKIEGKRAGEIAGNDPNWRPTASTTIRGAAADEAGVATYLNNLDAKVRSGMSDLYQKHQNDPAALKASLDQFKAQLQKDDVFDIIAGSFNASFERARLPLQVKALENQQGVQRDQARAAAVQAGNAGETLREQQIRAGNPASPATRAAIEDSLAADDARDQQMVKAEQMTAEEAQRKRIARRRDAEVSLLLEQGERLTTPDAVKAYREEVTRKFGEKKLPGQLDADGLSKVEAGLAQREQKLRAGGKQELGTVSGLMDAIVRQQADGIPSNPDEVRAVREKARSLPGGDVLVRKFDGKLLLNSLAKVKTPAELDDIANAVTAEAARAKRGLTVEEGERIEYLRQLAASKRRAVASDPVTYATKQGIVEAPAAIVVPGRDEDVAGGVSRQITSRVATAQAAADALKTNDIRYLTESDRETLKSIAGAGDPRTLRILKGIVDGAGRAAPKILAEIGGDMPELAQAGNLLVAGGPGGEQAARDIIGGIQLRKTKDANLPKLPRNAAALRKEVLGSTMSDDAGTKVDAAAKAIFQTRAYGNVDPATREGEELYRDSLRAAVGASKVGGKTYGGVADYKPGYWHSYKVPVPPTVQSDRFKDVIGALRDEDLGGASDPDGKPISAKTVRGAIPVKVKGGYAFSLDDPSSASPRYLGKPGAPLVVDVEKLEPELRKRVPGAYLDGGAK